MPEDTGVAAYHGQAPLIHQNAGVGRQPVIHAHPGRRSTTMKTSAKLATLGTLVACAGAASLPSALAAGPTARTAKATTVTLKNISFIKSTVRIAKGSSVTWVWKDGPTPHNVTFAAKHSKTQKKGTYTLKFAKAGTFTYHCTIHPNMDGKVVVR